MDKFFTPGTFATFAGCTVFVVVVVNTVRHAFSWGPRWFALLLSLGVAGLAFVLAPPAGGAPPGFRSVLLLALIILGNGCLTYTSAFGLQNGVIAPPAPRREPQELPALRLRFWTPW